MSLYECLFLGLNVFVRCVKRCLQTNGDEKIKWDKYWNPKLAIENAYGDTKETKWRTVTFDSNGLATVVEKRRVNGAFLEYMELNQFPFDMQVIDLCALPLIVIRRMSYPRDLNVALFITYLSTRL